jgi:hypothetical protein
MEHLTIQHLSGPVEIQLTKCCNNSKTTRKSGQYSNYSDEKIRWMIPGYNPGRGKRFFSILKCPDHLCETPGLLLMCSGDNEARLWR